MTSSSEQTLVPVTLTTNCEATRIRVFDAQLNRVERAFGGLHTELPPGIYDVQLQLGSTIEQRLIALKPGHPYEEHVELTFYSAAPFPRAELYDKEHAASIAELTTPRELPAGHGELVVFLRLVTDDATLLDDDVLAAVRIIDASSTEIATLGRAEKAGQRRCAGIRLPLKEGGYALRHPLFDTEGSSVELDHSIVVCAGWRTIIFVPVRKQGQDASLASVHMMLPGEQWIAEDPARQRIGIAAEALLASFRVGRNAFSPDLLQLALEDKAGDPMLGILAAHSLLMTRDPDWKTIDAILGHLCEKIPAHPDLLALRAISIDAQHRMHSTDLPPIDFSIEWPPMLIASYQGALQVDARWPEIPLIREDSVAERAAARLVSQETWCAWEALPDTPRTLEDDASFQRLQSYITDRVRRAATGSGTGSRAVLERLCTNDERVRIGLATGLPSKAVEHGLRALRDVFEGRKRGE